MTNESGARMSWTGAVEVSREFSRGSATRARPPELHRYAVSCWYDRRHILAANRRSRSLGWLWADGMSPARTLDDANIDPSRIRLLTKIARMYHERGLRQPEIAQRLHISQASVSRLLKKATEVGIVRTVVVTPDGVYADLEERVEQAFDLEDVVVVDTDSDNSDEAIMRALGAAAAVYLEETLTGGDRIGISSWSSTLLSMVDSMQTRSRKAADEVVQVLGGLGAVAAQATATRLTGRLAQLTGARAVYVPAPGLVSSPATRQALVSDPAFATVEEAWQQLSLLLVGIGSLEPSFLLRQSGNAIATEDSDVLRQEGAVGDVCLRFFDSSGRHISTLDERVIGIGVDTMRRTPRRVGVAGGPAKYAAIRAAIRGGWVNVLITDQHTAQQLAEESPADQEPAVR
jgi:DNA-binding transcriptional regulator LsrR (DeoR family)